MSSKDTLIRSEDFATSQQRRSIELQIVEGAGSVSHFADDWDDLFVRAVDAPPYLSRPWVSTFIQEGRIKGTPQFILAWCANELVALFPLAVRKSMNTKIAEPIGTSQPSYLGLLLDPNHRLVVEDIAELIASEKVFDVYYSTDLSSEDLPTNDLLAKLAKKGYSCRKIFRNPCRRIQLGTSFDEYLKNKIKKGKRRYKLRYEEKKLFKYGDVRIARYIGKDITPKINSRVAAIQLESWMKRRDCAVLGQPFYQKLLMNMAEAGLSHVWLMTINGEDAAFAYSFIAHGKLHYYWPAFKLKYDSSLSIGQMLLMHTIREACKENILSFDFVHGDAEYKRFWANECYSVYRMAAGRGFTGRLMAICYCILWRMSNVKWCQSLFGLLKSIKRKRKTRELVDGEVRLTE